MSFIKKSWFSKLLVSFLFLLIISPSGVSAQIVGSSKNTEVVNESKIPLVVKIENFAYSNDKRLVTISLSAENQSGSFADNLKYNLEFHQGEKLEKTGLIFRNLKYIFSVTGEFERVSPGQKIRKTIQYELPENIPGGPYFVRGVVSNDELSVYGVGYTKEPIRLTGLGGFILKKSAGLIDVDNAKVYRLMEGPTLEKDGNYLIAFPKASNKEIYDFMDEQEIYSDFIVTHISDGSKVVYEKLNVPLSTLKRDDDFGLEFKIEPWENIQSGAHTLVINFKNAKGQKVSEDISARLLFRGLLGRIYEIDTHINSYRKGEPINLVVNTVVAGDENAKKAHLTAIFKNEGNTVQEVEKEIELNATFNGTDSFVDFSDQKIKSKTLIDEVEIILKAEDGTVLDSQIITMDTSKVFAYPKDSHLFRNILISLLVLIIALVTWAVVKKKINFTLASIVVAMTFVGGSIVFSNPNLILAQYGDSNDYVYGCTDYYATNYNEFATVDDGSCEYGPPTVRGCTNPSATNYNPSATEDDGSCTTDVYGCTDPTASNYNSSATFDDGLCTYGETGCTDPTAKNFNPGATVDNGTCEYAIKGCMDERARNYDPSAEEDDGTCRYRNGQLTRELLSIWSVPDGQPSGDQGICTTDCIPTEFYVRVQCKECANQAQSVDIYYFNNWKGEDLANESPHNDYYRVVGNSDNMLMEFSVYVLKDGVVTKTTYNTATPGKTWTDADDVKHEWIWGPFIFDFCFENFDENGKVNKSLSDPEDGLYHQFYAVLAQTTFGGSHCQAEAEGGLINGQVANIDVREMMCSIPAELRASFFIDYNEDGSKNADEPYIKSGDSSESCYGSTGAPLGFIRNSAGDLSVGGLSPDNCEDDYIPYFFQDLLVPGNYQSKLDPDNAFGWIQTGVQYFVNSSWITDNDFIPLISSDVMKSMIGLRRDSDMPVAISCSATPRTTREFPKTIAWRIDNGTFWSDEYDMSDLEFVWRGVGGPPTSDVLKSGAENNGQYTIEYNQGTGGPGEYRMSVYARNSQGETVSNTATCEVDIIPMIAACGAYGSLGAIESGSPQTFFNLTDDVYWNVDVQNGSDYMYYSWSGSYLGAESGNDGNKTVGPINYSELGVVPGTLLTANVEVDGADGVDAEASCSIFIRECLTDDDCLGGKICNLGTYTCVLPPPVFTSPLSLNPSVINTGEQCGLSWEVQNEDVCEIYKNNVLMPIDWGEGMTSLNVDAGTYTMICRNEDGLSVTGGPVTCLMNPDIRER